MLRGLLCVSIVAAFPLTVGAAGATSEEIPIPGGRAALVQAAGIREVPDRARFVAEITRLTSEAPLRDRQRAAALGNRLRAHLLAAARLQRAFAAAQVDGAVSLTVARDGAGRRQLGELLGVVGLRLRDRRGVYSIESTDNIAAADRLQQLANFGIHVDDLNVMITRGEAITFGLPVDTVPLPLSAALWSEVILERKVPANELLAAILGDDRATLLCYGLAGLDDPTLEYLAANPPVLRTLYERAAVFAAFGSHLVVRDGRVVTPGEVHGEQARIIWEDLVEARATDPGRFIASLFERRAGRLAYLYDLAAELDPARAAFVLHLWIQDPALSIERNRALVEALSSAYQEWPSTERPFVRPLHEFGSLVMSIAVNPDGSPRHPSWRWLWELAFESQDLQADPTRFRETDRPGSFDPAWLAETVAMTDVRTRGERLMQVAFAFRVFDGAAMPDDDLLVALRAFVGYRTLALGLEQMGVRRPALYAVAARRAEALTRLEAGRAYVALSQFQGALALLVRLARTASIEPARLDALLTTLCQIPITSDGRLAGGIAEWLRTELLADQGDADAEHNLLTMLAGPAPETPRTIDWEGGKYRFDLAAAEVERLRRARRRQGGYSLDAALQLFSTARSLSAATIDLDGVKRGAAAVERLQKLLPRKPPVAPSEVVPGGASGLRDPYDLLEQAREDLSRLSRPRDAERAGDAARLLLEAVDIVMGEVLSSLAYALTIGNPDGPTLLGGDVARRHDFGIGSRVPGVRAARPWAQPEQHYDPGVPWHVTGSLVGLDVALASLSLKRLEGDGLFAPPVLGSNDRETFARTVALMNPYALEDGGRDRIATAIARGQQRLTQARTVEELDSLADAVRMDGWRRRALRWTAANDAGRKSSLLSLIELFVLGGGDLEAAHAWGSAMTPVWGCFCTRLQPPNAWRFATGRPQVGVLGSSMPDLMLHVAAGLQELDLPAGLARSVLSTAAQQFVDTVRPNDGNDWLSLVRGVQEISRERLEDFVAAAAAVGGPLVPVDTPLSRDR
jgi:hypothetical protein